MECACIDANDGNYAMMLGDHKIKARTTHICCECKRKILPSEVYRKEVAVYDGKVATYKTCSDCNSIRDEFVCSWYWGEIHEAVRESVFSNLCDISESGIANLTPRARGLVCEWIEECWEWHDED